MTKGYECKLCLDKPFFRNRHYAMKHLKEKHEDEVNEKLVGIDDPLSVMNTISDEI